MYEMPNRKAARAPRGTHPRVTSPRRAADPRYPALIKDLGSLLESARRASARAVNALMTATYWEAGRRIVEYEQGGARRAAYGKELLQRLSSDLTARFGRGFGVDNLELFRAFYLAYPPDDIGQVVAGKSESAIRESGSSSLPVQKSESPIRKFSLRDLAGRFPLPWTHYVHLLRRARSDEARRFYEAEAAARRLVCPAARPADRLTVLRAHRPLPEQGRDARPGHGGRSPAMPSLPTRR